MAITESEQGSLYAVTIEVRHDCPVGNLSRKLPQLRIVHWCPHSRDIFQVSGPDNQVQLFREWVIEGFGARQVSATADGVLLVTESCKCGVRPGTSVTSIMRSVGAWDIPPIVYREGWESWRVIAMNEACLREMFAELRKIGELRIVSMRPIENFPMEKMMLMPASDVFSGLTDRQSSSVLLGLRHGYYSLPSGTDIQRLAQGVGLSASTFSEHLRKAEARILQNLRPYLEAYALRAPGDVAVAEVRDATVTRGRGRDTVPVESA